MLTLDDHRDYSEHGPCGPTAFWKVADREYDSNSDETGEMLNNLLPLRTPFFSPMELALVLTVVVDNDDDDDDSDDPDAEENEDSDEHVSESDEVDEEEEEEDGEDEDEDLDHELEEELETEAMAVFGGGNATGSGSPPGQGLRGGGGENDGGNDDRENRDRDGHSDVAGREHAGIEPPSDAESNVESEDEGWPYEDGYDPYEEEEAYMQEMAQLPRYELNADYRRFNDMMAARFQIGMPEPDDDEYLEP